MHKAIFALNRKESMDQEEFRHYWQEDHAALGRELPHLVKYTLAFPLEPDDSEWDGVAELYYENQEDLNESLNSDAFIEVMGDVPNFAEPNGALQLLVEESTQLDRTDG